MFLSFSARSRDQCDSAMRRVENTSTLLLHVLCGQETYDDYYTGQANNQAYNGAAYHVRALGPNSLSAAATSLIPPDHEHVLLIGFFSEGKDSGVAGFPQRAWSIEIHVLNEHGEPTPTSLFDKVTYRLHPSFGDRAVQSAFNTRLPMEVLVLTDFVAFKTPPFRIEEEGWGEFDMTIGLFAPDKEHTITHDLNFQQSRYESKHVIVRSIFRLRVWR